MPVSVSYPGVYIQELPSGSRTVTGVATSITAFIGRTARGPVNVATTIQSQTDFDRQFGGIARNSPLSFAVRDFYNNGGSTAVIVRLFNKGADADGDRVALFDVLDEKTPQNKIFQLAAANPGSWGKSLTFTIDGNTSKVAADGLGVGEDFLFNITISDGKTTEVFRNVTLKDSARRIDRVLADSSTLAAWPASVPYPTTDTLATTLSNSIHAIKAQKKVLGSALASTKVQDGGFLTVEDYDNTKSADPTADHTLKIGLRALEQIDLFNILVVPPNLPPSDPSMMDGDLDPSVVQSAALYAQKRRAILLIDPPAGWTTKKDAVSGGDAAKVFSLGDTASNAALFFPRICYPDPFNDNRIEAFVPSGAIAGIMARTDTERGVWKAPAGLDAAINGISSLSVELTDLENGELNTLAVNCLRTKAGVGPVVWGSRTREGDDRVQSQWKYLSVRRIALFLEESLFRGTEWVVFEPNDEPLWSQIRTNLGAFMQGLFLQGAFQGQTPEEAYFVKCDDETTTQENIDQGIVNIIVGFAPLKPAEFVIISLQQMSGQTA